MNKPVVLLIAAISLFASFGLISKSVASRHEPVLITATPKPKIFAQIAGIDFDKKEVLIGCPPQTFKNLPERSKDPRFCDYYAINQFVAVKTHVSNPKNVPLTYQYTVSGGRITGEGANVTWDLSGVRPGIYAVTVSIKGKRGVSDETQTKSITLRECECPLICVCPTLEIEGSENVKAGEIATFTAKVSGGTAAEITYNWTISRGEILEGQGTSAIKVLTTADMAGLDINAAVEIGGYSLCGECERTDLLVTSIIK